VTYSIDASGGDDRVRILFTEPYVFEVDLRYLRVHGTDPVEYQLAVNTHSRPVDSNAMVAFVQNLTPSRLAEFCNDVAEYMLSKAAEINGG
jgi:hypothetical protein